MKRNVGSILKIILFFFVVYDIVGSSAISTLVNTLSGHKERVVSVAWNPHQDAVLLSASYDGTAQVRHLYSNNLILSYSFITNDLFNKVWNVKENQALSNFGEHGGRLFCCEWSHLEPDTAITGSEDLTVRRWRVKDQIYKTPAESLAVRRSLEKKRDLPTPTASSVAGPDRHSGNAAGSKKGPGKLKSLFPISAVMEGRNRTEGLKDCKILATLKGKLHFQNLFARKNAYLYINYRNPFETFRIRRKSRKLQISRRQFWSGSFISSGIFL